MKAAILSKMPPDDLCALTLQRQPYRDVGFMIKVGHYDLAAFFQCLANGDADEPHERSGVHSKRNFVGMPRIYQQRNALPRLRYGLINFLGLLVAAASLDISIKKVVGDSIQDGPGGLCSRRVIKENKSVL